VQGLVEEKIGFPDPRILIFSGSLEMDTIQKLQQLSLINKVTSELENHGLPGERDLAEFVIHLAGQAKNVSNPMLFVAPICDHLDVYPSFYLFLRLRCRSSFFGCKISFLSLCLLFVSLSRLLISPSLSNRMEPMASMIRFLKTSLL
jgi:hypothetical protein